MATEMANSSTPPSFSLNSSSFPPLSTSRPHPNPPASSDDRSTVDPVTASDVNRSGSASKVNQNGSTDQAGSAYQNCRSDNQPNFASLFQSLPRNAGQYKPIQFDIVKDGPIPDLVKDEGLKYWNNILIGFFIDGTLPYTIVSSFLKSRWKLLGDFTVRSDGFHFYIQFSNENDREKVLRSDPLFIRGRMFILSQWDPNIGNPQKLIKRVPVWIQFTNIPLIFWTLVGINWLACHVGKLICFDYSTEKMQRFSFAKALVEVNAEAELPDSIVLSCLSDKPTVNLSYIWKPSICVSCKCFGHRTSECFTGDKYEEVNVMHKENNNDQNQNHRFNSKNQNTGRNKAYDKDRGWTRVISKKKMVWEMKNGANTNTKEVNLDKGLGDENLNVNGDAVNNNTDETNGVVNNASTGKDDNGDTAVNIASKSKEIDIDKASCSLKTGQAKEGKEIHKVNSGKSVSFEGDFDLHLLFNDELNVGKRSDKAVGGASSSNISASPYSHLKTPPNISLPPPPVGSASDPTRFSTSSTRKLPLISSKSKKLKGKFWADDLDEGVEYSQEDVLPLGSNLKSSKRHTRNNPMYDPTLS